MKKLLKLLCLVTLTGATTSTVIACGGNSSSTTKADINKVLKIADLGTITTGGTDIPSETQIKTAIKNKNSDINTDWFSVTNIKNTSAQVVGDNINYINSITVNYSVEKTIDINTVLTTTDLGTIATGGSATPSAQQISDAIVAANPSIDTKGFSISNQSTTGATVTGDGTIYSGSVNVTYVVNSSVALNTVLTNTDLGTIATAGSATPSAQQISDAIVAANPSIDTKGFSISNQSTTSATVTGDGTIYSGSVNVTYVVNSSVALNTVLTTTDLGTITTGGSATPSAQQISDAIVAANPSIDTKGFSISNQSTTGATVTGDGTIYTGTLTVSYLVDSSVALNTVLTTTNLGTITTEGSNIPTDQQISDAIVAANPQINRDGFTISNQSNTGATITGDETIYTGSVNVSYIVNQTVQLNSVVTVTSLGNVATQNGQDPTADSIKNSVKDNNAAVDNDFYNVSSITATGATLTGDGINYTGTVQVQFTITPVDLNTVLTTTALGTIATGGGIPTTAQLKTALLSVNPNLNVNALSFGTISTSSAIIGGDNVHYNGDAISVTYTVS